MIIDKFVKIRVNNFTLKYYESLGYYSKTGEEIEISIEHLKIQSNIKINVKCDVCVNEKMLSYDKYNKNVKNGGYYACCGKCSKDKKENTLLNKYGEKNYNNRYR